MFSKLNVKTSIFLLISVLERVLSLFVSRAEKEWKIKKSLLFKLGSAIQKYLSQFFEKIWLVEKKKKKSKGRYLSCLSTMQ